MTRRLGRGQDSWDRSGAMNIEQWAFISSVSRVSTPTISSITEHYRRTYGQVPTVIARAPGRVEFIGNHTDYNGGAVLGAAIDRYVWVAAAANPVGRLRLFSVGGKSVLELPADPGTKIAGSDSWANY